jgi:hypothetical protein
VTANRLSKHFPVPCSPKCIQIGIECIVFACKFILTYSLNIHRIILRYTRSLQSSIHSKDFHERESKTININRAFIQHQINIPKAATNGSSYITLKLLGKRFKTFFIPLSKNKIVCFRIDSVEGASHHQF